MTSRLPKQPHVGFGDPVDHGTEFPHREPDKRKRWLVVLLPITSWNSDVEQLRFVPRPRRNEMGFAGRAGVGVPERAGGSRGVGLSSSEPGASAAGDIGWRNAALTRRRRLANTTRSCAQQAPQVAGRRAGTGPRENLACLRRSAAHREIRQQSGLVVAVEVFHLRAFRGDVHLMTQCHVDVGCEAGDELPGRGVDRQVGGVAVGPAFQVGQSENQPRVAV